MEHFFIAHFMSTIIKIAIEIKATICKKSLLFIPFAMLTPSQVITVL